MDAVHSIIEAVGLTDQGHGREKNEDAFLVDNERALFVVADGIGGRKGGDMAARAVVNNLASLLDRRLRASHCRVASSLRDTVLDLNAMIRTAGQRSADLHGMGSTLACLFIRGRKAYIANMGDSRVYLWHDGLTCLTKDHSLTALLIREGEISVRSAAHHPARGQLTRYVGMQQDIYPDVSNVRWRRGDRFLLCTDGLWNVLPDKRIGELLDSDATPDFICAKLIAAANERGSRDNITCVLVTFGARSAPSKIDVEPVHSVNEALK